MSKTVYSFDPSTRAFVTELTLDNGDLSPLESCTYLIPGNCLEVRPPVPTPGKWPFAVAGAWVMDALPVDAESEPEPAPTEEERRTRLKAAITAHRWMIEAGGITLPGGLKIKTAINDQTRIAQVIQGMEVNGHADVSFKAESGWFMLTLAQMYTLQRAIASHVRACFEAERSHHEAIDALDASTVEHYDILANWPSAQV